MFGNKKSNEPDATVIDALDGPSQAFEVHAQPQETKRLSQKGKFIIVGSFVFLTALILMGVMTSGKTKQDAAAPSGSTATTDAPGQAAAYSESPADIKKRQEERATETPENPDPNPAGSDNQSTALTTRNATKSAGGQNMSGSGSGGSTPPTPAEAHRLWLDKRKYERIQGRILAAESAETSDINKGGASLGSSKAAVASNAEPNVNGEFGSSGIGQRLAAANGRASNARAMAAAEAMRIPGSPQGADAGYMPTSTSATLDPAVAAQARNKAFLKEAAENGYLAEVLKPKLGQYEITAGSVIPAVMLSGINSDLPGTIIAQTRQTVYSTNDPSTVLIPQGARLIGRYSADVAFGQERILAAWDEMILPNGARISLRGMAAADGQGQSGIEDQVNNHFFKTWGSALLVSMLGVAAQQSQPQNQGTLNTPSASAQAAAAAMNSLSEVGSKILQKNLNVSPTLQVRPGMTFNVMVNRSVILPAYH